jgi:hypothetical protein
MDSHIKFGFVVVGLSGSRGFSNHEGTAMAALCISVEQFTAFRVSLQREFRIPSQLPTFLL